MTDFRPTKMTVTVNGKSIQISNARLTDCIWFYGLMKILGEQNAAEIFEELVESDCYEIREAAFFTDVLSANAIESLLDDPVEEIVLMLQESLKEAQAKLLNQETILTLINRSPLIASNMAVLLGVVDWEGADVNLTELFTILSEHPDPAVRAQIAAREFKTFPGNVMVATKKTRTPKYLLEKLAKDDDRDVAEIAMKTLEVYEGEINHE